MKKQETIDYSSVTVKHIFKDGTVRDTPLGYDFSKTITPEQTAVIFDTLDKMAEIVAQNNKHTNQNVGMLKKYKNHQISNNHSKIALQLNCFWLKSLDTSCLLKGVMNDKTNLV